MVRHLHTFFVTLFICAGVLVFAPSAQADKLSIFDEPAAVERPQRGMTMSAVEQQYGKPETVVDAVGEPPITRWVYDNFTVYFEHNRVIHAVVHRK
ncbi:MAG: hypothetical protein PVH46_02800 [Granulosicoccaceae bacterium]|jgi:hypothetical protein